jgi:hypothetical protein
MSPPQPDAAARQAQQRIAAELAHIDYALPGSVLERMMRCGSRRCARCTADPPQLHGPYLQWSRKVDGKTTSKLLTPEKLARYQPWFDNARRLHDLIAELQSLTLQIVERAEGWHR